MKINFFKYYKVCNGTIFQNFMEQKKISMCTVQSSTCFGISIKFLNCRFSFKNLL